MNRCDYPEASSTKKIYKRPKLTKFGTLRNLTQQHFTGAVNDKGANAMSPS